MNLTTDKQNTLNQAEALCSSQGVRLTHKRKQVLTALLQTKKAMSAYELVEYCKSELDEALPAMSIYRILEFLQTKGLVHKLNLVKKFIACAHINEDHKHLATQFLICNKCQQVKEISTDAAFVSKFTKAIKSNGFHLVSPQIEMNCICGVCYKQA